MFESNDSNSRNILRSESPLETGHQPEELVGRKEEIKRIAEAIKPIRHCRKPENLLVYGPAGVGKTTCVRHVFDRLEQETRAKAVHLNCWQYNTRSSLLTELLIQLGYPAPRKGKPVDELLSKLREWLDKNRGVAVALDEFDQLQEKTEVIYDLQMVNEDAENQIALVMVSNQQPSQLDMDQRSQSRLNWQTLQFKPYTQGQLRDILEKRVELAFQPGAISGEVINKIADHVAENSEDCREALDVLLRAGRKADTQQTDKISFEMIRSWLQDGKDY